MIGPRAAIRDLILTPKLMNNSLADALRAAGRGGTVTLLTNATAPASLVRGRTIVPNGYILVTYNDWKGTLFFMQ